MATQDDSPATNTLQRVWRPLVWSAAAAIVVGGLSAWTSTSLVWSTWPVTGLVLVWSTVSDLRHRRIPDAVVIPGAAAIILLQVGEVLISGAPGRLGTSIAAAAASGTFYLLVALVGRGMGAGDVKLAVVVGLALGWLGWRPALSAVVLAYLLGGLVAALVLAWTRDRRATVPFAPAIAVGATLAAVLAQA